MKSLIIVLCVGLTFVSAEVVQHTSCRNEVINCVVHEVRVEPCPEAATSSPCKIKRGRSATISFDYTTEFNATAARGEVFWVSSAGDLPFVGMNNEACSYTSCPLQTNITQTYTYSLDIGKKFPTRIFEIKWKLTNPETKDLCCFQTKIKLVK